VIIEVVRRIPKSSKGEETWKKIYDSAQKLFLNLGYHKTSILAISRDSKVSPATIYQYFESKDGIFEMILESFQEEFFSLITKAFKHGFSIEEKMEYLVNSFFDSVWRYRSEFKVYREAEFIDKNLAIKFHMILSTCLQENFYVADSDLYPPVVLWFIIGPLMYIGTFWVLWKKQPVPEDVKECLIDFYINGISPTDYTVSSSVYNVVYDKGNTEVFPDRTRGEKTRDSLLKSAEILFGRNGFIDTNIHEIVTMSGCSVGTFYIYFKSKQDILSTLVSSTSKHLRRHIRDCTRDLSDRRDVEIGSLMAFLDFFRRHLNIYAIVREGEFVDEKISLDYYNSLKKPYVTAISKAIINGQMRDLHVESLASILMGIGHLLGHSLIILGKVPKEEHSTYIEHLSDLILNGCLLYTSDAADEEDR